MHILHVISSLDPAEGGPPVVVTRLGAAQQERGHEVDVLSHAGPGDRKRIDDMISSLPCNGLQHVHLLNRGGRIERLRANNSRAWLREHVGRYELVHLHGIWDPILNNAAREAARAGTDWIITPHGMLDPWCMSQGRLRKRVALAAWARKMLSGSRFIHALNHDEELGMKPHVGSARIEVIPNGVFLEELEPLPPAGTFRSRHQGLCLDTKPFVLFLSRLHYKKGLDILVAAFERIHDEIPELDLVIAGPDDGYETTLQSLIEASPARNRMHCIGPLYGEDKLAALVDCNCFCLPSRQEGFSMAITEALGCGTPVIITEACHFPEVADAGAGLVTSLDAAAVAEAMLQLASSPETCEQMGRAGASLVRDHYTWPAIAARLDTALGLE